MQQEKKIYRKANLVYEDCDIKPGHTIKLYGEETIVKGFHVSYNDALGRWETIILTEGRGDPFERTLADIEVLEDQPDESPSRVGKADHPIQLYQQHKESKEGNKEREVAIDEKHISEMRTLSFAEEAAAWAEKNGYKWENFAYWKGGKEYPIQEIYNNAYIEKRAGEMLPKVTETVKWAEDFLKELKQKANQQNRNNVNS